MEKYNISASIVVYNSPEDAFKTVETVLDKCGVFYTKSEIWIESEKFYEILYSFDMEA